MVNDHGCFLQVFAESQPTTVADDASAILNAADAVAKDIASVSRAAGNPTVANVAGDVTQILNPVEGIAEGIAKSVAGDADAPGGNTSKTGQEISNIVGDIASVAKVAADVAPFASVLGKLMAPVKLGGAPESFVNWMVALAIGVVLVGILGAYAVVYGIKSCNQDLELAADRPAPWCLGLLTASYALLIPGLFQVLFSVVIAVSVFGFHIVVTQNPPGHPHAITESMWSLINLLATSGSWIGALLVTLYAICIPISKVLLLIMAEAWRHNEDPGKVRCAARCIWVVQIISKWACPDMFAYVMVLYLFRSLNAGLIESIAALDTGFTFFSIFCVGSTVSSLAIPIPKIPDEEEDKSATEPPPLILRCLGSRGVFIFMLILALSFFGVLGVGISFPCMGLHLDAHALVKPHGPLPAAALPILEGLDVSKLVSASVSMVKAAPAMVQYLFEYGELNALLAAIMLFVFAFALPILDMIVILTGAWHRCFSSDASDTKMLPRLVDISHFLKHLEMLDVMSMGVIVIVAAGSVYKKNGIVMELEWGLALLITAELIHYVSYFIVLPAVAYDGGLDEETAKIA